MLKNTFFLYIRMFVIMCINLVAVRLLLQALGETDYGIFNVVGGVVAMLSFLSSTMSSASQRFYACHLGTNNVVELRKVFGVSVSTFILIVIVSVIIAETFGLWVVSSKLTIPLERMHAAYWVYQFSIVTFSMNILCVPFVALVIASERMNFYAIVSVVDSVLKLIIILLISVLSYDKLLFYGGLYMLISFANIIAYIAYTRKCFRNEVGIRPLWDAKSFKDLFSYCSWYMFGSVAQVVRSQGINILLNIFFNPIVNTARGLAYQVNAAVSMFVTSFYQAVRPQIIKRYASEEYDSIQSLVINSTKFSYYLVLLFAIPLIVLMPEVLGLWLHTIPDNAVLFTRLVIIITMIDTTGFPLSTSICADGNIKLFQIVSGCILLLNLPVSYIFLRMGGKPETTMYIAILMAIIAQVVRVHFAKNLYNLNLKKYGKMTIVLLLTTILSFALPGILKEYIPTIGIMNLVLHLSVDIIWIMLVVMSIGLNVDERKFALIATRKIIFKGNRNEA